MTRLEAPAAEQTESLADQAYELILMRILNGRLEPGTALSIPALARLLDVGRSPVREAVQKLIHEGLAVHEQNRGAIVTKLQPAELPDIYETKEPLEGLAARRAAERVTDPAVAELREMIARQRQVVEDSYLSSTLMSLDIEYHHFIAELSGNVPLAAVLRQFTTRTQLVVPSAWVSIVNARQSIQDHVEIADAIIRGDADAAEAAARRHTRNVCIIMTTWLDLSKEERDQIVRNQQAG